jgi:hypothetical protein
MGVSRSRCLEIRMIVALLWVRVCSHVYILTLCCLEQLPGWSAVYTLFHEDVSCPASWSPKLHRSSWSPGGRLETC